MVMMVVVWLSLVVSFACSELELLEELTDSS